LPALNPINNAVGSRLRVTTALPTIPPAFHGFSWLLQAESTDFDQIFAGHARLLTDRNDISTEA